MALLSNASNNNTLVWNSTNNNWVNSLLPVNGGGTGLSTITTNGVLIGNGTNNPTIQTINSVIIDSQSSQSVENKIINGNCNSLTNVIWYGGLVNSANQTITTGATQVVTLSTIDIASNSPNIILNTSSNSITAVETGVYMVNATVDWTTQPTGTTFTIFVLINGVVSFGNSFSTFTPGLLGANGSMFSESFSRIINITSPNSNISLTISQNSGGSLVISGTAPYMAHLQLHKLP